VNYLAHAYLSFGDPQITTGNIISDFVKGKRKFDYPARIQAGIALHRSIDQFTDDHPVNKEIVRLLKPVYGLYGSAFIDIIYDHFVALDIIATGDEALYKFSQEVYRMLDMHVHLLPDVFNNLFPYMKKHNWLYNYQFGWGIERSMEGLVSRARYMSDSQTAYNLFTQHYDEFRQAYNNFFPELRNFSLEKFSDIH
jgi:acyl carrier protein phosphodiesterase